MYKTSISKNKYSIYFWILDINIYQGTTTCPTTLHVIIPSSVQLICHNNDCVNFSEPWTTVEISTTVDETTTVAASTTRFETTTVFQTITEAETSIVVTSTDQQTTSEDVSTTEAETTSERYSTTAKFLSTTEIMSTTAPFTTTEVKTTTEIETSTLAYRTGQSTILTKTNFHRNFRSGGSLLSFGIWYIRR